MASRPDQTESSNTKARSGILFWKFGITKRSEDSGFTAINNALIYYEVAGEGRPFVMIHAGVADHRQWNNEFTNFAKRYRSPDGSPGGMEARLKMRLNRDRLPLALVALDGEDPVGTISLKIQELDSRTQYPNWLGFLYVPEEFRRRGIGSQLVRAAEKTASKLGLDCLYLYTHRAINEPLYTDLGWARLEELVYDDRPAVIMRKHLEIH